MKRPVPLHTVARAGYALPTSASTERGAVMWARRRAGLSLADSVVLLLVLACLAPVLCCFAGRSREQANRVKCSNNLQQIALGAIMYANNEKGIFPRTFF